MKLQIRQTVPRSSASSTTPLFRKTMVTFPRSALLVLATLTTAVLGSTQQQHPLMAESAPLPFARTNSVLPLLADRLTQSRRTTIFYDYSRDSATLTRRLGSTNEQTTLLVPLNSAIVALARKPHQGPPPPVSAEAGEVSPFDTKEEEQAKAAYLEKWLEGHAVAGDNIDLDAEGWESKTWTTMSGGTISFEKSGEGRKLMPGGIELVGVEEVRLSRLAVMMASKQAS